MLLTLAWWGSAIMGPAVLARHAMKQGKLALNRRQYPRATRYLQRAARYQPLREEAVCLLAEAAIEDNRPSDALFALNTYVMEREEAGTRERSPRVRLLRGIAACMLGRGPAARRELADVPRQAADIDERLAAAQACIMADDTESALKLLETIPDAAIGGTLSGRVKLCRAAAHYRRAEWGKCTESLPKEASCSPRDAVVLRRIRDAVREKAAG